MDNAISKRILQLLEQRDMSYGELANITGIPKSALQRYATGDTTKIPVDRISQIAKALGVSASYLLGWDETDTRIMYNIKKHRDKWGVTQEDLAEFINVSVEDVNDWENGYSSPSYGQLIDICRALNTTHDELTEVDPSEKARITEEDFLRDQAGALGMVCLLFSSGGAEQGFMISGQDGAYTFPLSELEALKESIRDFTRFKIMEMVKRKQ